jgi:hypothetical protein
MTTYQAPAGWWNERLDRLAILGWAWNGGRWPRWVDADRRARLQVWADEIDAAVRDPGYRPGR